MKKPGLLTIVLAAILCTAPLSLHWISNEIPSLSVDRANAQNKTGVNRRPVRPSLRTERALLFWQSVRQLPIRQSQRELRQSVR